MKGKKPAQTSDLNKANAENTQFLGFLYEDFLAKTGAKDAKTKLVIDTKEVLIHACAQYKSLLELPPLNFWSTLNFNAYLSRSLDSFLSFARRWHFSVIDLMGPDDNPEHADRIDFETFPIKKHLQIYFNELYRAIFCVYQRMSADPYDKAITHKINYAEVIYQHWLFDLPKFLDLCAIYYESDADKLRKMLFNVFELEPAYYDDYLDFVKELTDSIIPNNLSTINRHRKREDLDAATMKSDTDEKEKVLIVLYDVIYHLKLIGFCFPKKCLEDLYYDKKFLLLLENAYLILNSCSKTWRVSPEKQDLLTKLVRRINNTIFRVFERVYNCIFGSILLAGSNDKISKDKKLWSTMSEYLKQSGKTMLKKKEDEPNFKFLRKLMRYVDFGAILKKLPAGILKEEEIQDHQVLLMVLKEKTDALVVKKFGNSDETKAKFSVGTASPEKPAVDEDEDFGPIIKEVKPIEKKPSVIDKEAESTKEAIKIIEMTFGKKNKELNIFDEDEVRGAMQATLKLAGGGVNVYDDEYDDTLEMYEEDRLRVGGDKAEDEEEDNDEENVNIEGTVKPEEGGKPGGYKGKRGDAERSRNDGYKGGNYGKTYEERGKGKDQQYQGGRREEERGGQEGYKYQGNRDDRGYKGDRYQEKGGYQGERGGNYQGDRYQTDKYQGNKGDRYQEKGDRYQGDRYQGDKYQEKGGYQGDRYQEKGGYQGERGGNYQGDKYQGNRNEDKGGRGGGYQGGAYRENRTYYEKDNKDRDSYEEEQEEGPSKRDGFVKATPTDAGFNPKKHNRQAYQQGQKYKSGPKKTNEKEYVAKK